MRNAEYECGILFKKEKDKDRKTREQAKGTPRRPRGAGRRLRRPEHPASSAFGVAWPCACPGQGLGAGRGGGGDRASLGLTATSGGACRVLTGLCPVLACSGPGRDEHGESPHHQRGASRWVSRAATPRGAPDPPATAGHRPASPSTLAARCRAPGVLHVPWLSAGGWFVHEMTLKLRRARGSS